LFYKTNLIVFFSPEVPMFALPENRLVFTVRQDTGRDSGLLVAYGWFTMPEAVPSPSANHIQWHHTLEVQRPVYGLYASCNSHPVVIKPLVGTVFATLFALADTFHGLISTGADLRVFFNNRDGVKSTASIVLKKEEIFLPAHLN
jgi:hypothetical protein